MVSRAALALALLAVAQPAASQTTAREIAEISDISALTTSPDGKWVAYRIEQPSTATNRIDVDWYVALANGAGAPRRLGRLGTASWSDAGTVNPGIARWTPDSKSLVVSALVDGCIALWKSSVDGTGFRPIVAGDGDIEAFAILPDGGIVAREGPSRDKIARMEESERETGILVTNRVDLAEPLFRGSLVNGRPTTQRLTGDWFDRAPLLADIPRSFSVHGPATSAPRPATDAERALLDQAETKAPEGSLLAVMEHEKICIDLMTCRGDAPRLASWLQLADGRTLVSLRDPAFRQSLFVLPSGGTRLQPLVSSPGLLSGNREETAPCAASGNELFCVEASPAIAPRLVRIGFDGRKTIIHAPNKFPDSDRLLAETIAWQASGSRASGVLIRPKIPGRLPLFITYYRCPGFVRGGLGDEYPFHALAAHGIASLCINARPIGESAEDRYNVALETVAAAIADLDKRGMVDPARVGMGGLSFGSEVTLWIAAHSRLLKAAAIASVHVEPTYYWMNARPGRERFSQNLMRYWGLGPPDQTPDAWKRMSVVGAIEKFTAPVLMQLPENEMRQSVELQSKLAAARMGELHVFPLAPHIKVEPRQKLATYSRNLDWFRYWLKGERDPDPAKADQYERWSLLGPKSEDASIERTQRSASAISSSR